MRRKIILVSAILFIVCLGCIFCKDTSATIDGKSGWNGLSISNNSGGTSGCSGNISYDGSRSGVSAKSFFDCVYMAKGNHKDTIENGNYVTEFYIDLRPAGKCKTSGNCAQYSRFLCVSGTNYLENIDKVVIKDANVPSGASTGYDYYTVYFYPASWYLEWSPSAQTAGGIIRVRKDTPPTPEYTVTVEAREDARYLGADRDPKWPVLEGTMQSVPVKKGNSASLSSKGHEYAGYTWEQWGQGDGEICKAAYKNRDCTVSNVTSDQKALAYYVRNRFEGQMSATVNGAEISNTGYVGKTQGSDPDIVTENVTIDDCGNGCDVDFEFNLRTAAGSGSTIYKLAKQVNGGSWSWKFGSGNTQSWSSGNTIGDELTHINPGDTVCWYMSYTAVAAVAKPSSDGSKYGKLKTCVSVEAVGFEGRIEVSGTSDDGTIDYTTIDTEKTSIVNNCPSTGCQVSFNHAIKRNGGNNVTVYSTSRDSNLDSKVGDIPLTSLSNTSGGNVRSDSVMMYPGMKVCETLRFVPDIRQINTFTTLKTCVLAAGTADSSIDIKAKNENVDAYNSWQDSEIYAKPNDKIGLKGVYAPRYQYAYELMADSVEINNNVVVEQNWVGDRLETIFDENVNPGWNNAFSIDVFDNGEKNNLLNGTHVFTRDVGQDTLNEGILSGDNAYVVRTSDVGKAALVAKAETNGVTNASTTPKNIVFSYTNGRYGYSTNAAVNTDSISDSVSIRVPYNFNNTTAITSNVGSTNVPAGGQVDIKFNYSINPKPNTQTTNGSGEEYATSVDNAKWKLKYCFGAECDNGVYSYETPESEGTSYDVGLSEMSTGKTIDNLSQTVDIPDIEAGTKFCVKSSVYPANSGADNNYNNPNGSGTWVDSAEATCFKVGKQPSFQVWGGDIYSGKNISLPQTTKTINGEKRVFGSWAELGLVAKGKVTGLASGAGMGYDGLNLAANPGGSSKSDFCSMSTLSFNNTTCNSFVGEATQASALDLGMDLSDDEKMQNDGWTVFNNVDWPIPGGHYYSSTGIYEGWYGYGFLDEEKADKILWKKDGDVSIPVNIRRRGRDGGSNSWDDISKLVIYAKNIKISCGVTHIDAVLIAKDNIDTCANLARDNLDNRERSTPLRINGVIITDTLTLGRTYGAGKGADSIVPAEVINYDASLYSWASGQPGSASGGGLTEAYSSELAPRY